MAARRAISRSLAFALATAGVVALTTIVGTAAPSSWFAVDGRINFFGGAATYDWGNSGVGAKTPCPVGAVNRPGTGGIFNCGAPGGGSNPPIAPGQTPAAAADPSIISAVFVADPISADTTACGSGDPTVIGGGAKNGDTLTSIATTSGSVPDKDDLGNVYAVSHTRADTGHPEMFFAAERLVNNGDSHIDFEFLQTNAGVTASCSGTFTGHRTEGDLLVAVDFTGGGATAAASVYQWHCNAEPGRQPADGTVCDPAGVEHYQLIPTPTFLTFVVNATQIACGGWICRDKISGTTTLVAARDFLEGGIDLAGIPFTGCFNTFLPHTRTAQSFTSGLKDFAGPVSFHSCRTPASSSNSSPGSNAVAPGAAATDTVHVANGGAGLQPTGTVTFFLCGPAQVSGSGCVTGGTQVGAVKTLVAGSATSDPTSATTVTGRYCWRTEYAPDAASMGIYQAATHTNASTECFSVAAPITLPNTGAVPVVGGRPLPGDGKAVWLFAVLLLIGAGLAIGRGRGLSLAVCGALLVVSVPDPAQHGAELRAPSISNYAAGAEREIVPHHPVTIRSTPTAQAQSKGGWRLVIPEIGVDALIETVGVDRSGAMAAPASLDSVAWFNRGPTPGLGGDAVIAGHFGLPQDPAVFRNLALLETGALFQIVWPDGRVARFRVTRSEVVDATAPAPSDLFTRSGPARVSLVTCAGVWEQSAATYSKRLIVTAVPLD